MDQGSIGKAEVLKPQRNAYQLLSKASKGTDLAQIVARRNADTIRFTHFMLRVRLAKDLDATIGNEVAQNPEITDKFFIAIILDDFSTEVVKKEDFESIVEDLPEGSDKLKDPIGYFQRKDFPIKTPSDSAYRSLKDKLDRYFERNAEVIQYLRDHPETEVDPSQLYQPLA